ncbi:MAG: metal-dependent transcriptional regulator [Micrococcales bacterium]|nr:metal-dependent transcriptional regulator [Micrococcales bacterium]
MYLRTIFELEEEGIVPLRARIAERLGHSGPTVSQTVARMERDSLVSVSDDRHLELSEEGRRQATRVMRKHRLAERLLVDVIGLEWEYAHEEACRWEHVMSDQVERKILRLIDGGWESPYGNPIPGLEEFGVTESSDFRAGLVPLTEAAAQSPAVVTVRRIGEPVQVEPEALALLASAGILPGARIEVRAGDERVVAVRAGEDVAGAISLPVDVAQHVYCELSTP